MNLEEKKAEFENRPKISPEFRAITGLFDQTAVQKNIADLQMQTNQIQNVTAAAMKNGDPRLGLSVHLLFGNPLRQEISEKRAESFDTHYDCTAEYYRRVIEDMGFEKVGEYPHVKKDGREEKIFIHARPDGLFLTWDTFSMFQNDPIVNAANIHFQWVGLSEDDSPSGISGGWEKSQYDTWIYCGSCDVREGLREKINNLLSNGSFCSPFAVSDKYMRSSVLISSQDWSDFPETAKKSSLISMLAEERYNDLPVWTQQIMRPMRFVEYYHQFKPKNP